MTDGHEAGKVTRQAKISLIILACLSVALVSVAVVIVWAELREHPSFSPLHYTNPQTVTSRVDSLQGPPAARLGDTVDVTGTKCSDVDIEVEATTSWKPVEPRGAAIVTAADHAATRAEGCYTSRYQNDIPAEVARAVRAQHARGDLRPLWQIQGIETPLGPDGPGVAEVWTTEPFAIVP